MTAFTEPEQCSICHHTDKRDLTYRLAHWKDAPLGMQYEWTARCRDDTACRERLSLEGKPWPLVEEHAA